MKLAARAQHYLEDTLGLSVSLPRKWHGTGSLPYLVRDKFTFEELEIAGRPAVLALDDAGGITPEQIERAIAKIRNRAQIAIYVTPVLTSYDRKRLVERGVPFLVPDSQLHAPELGLAMREHFRPRPVTPVEKNEQLRPASQAMLISALLRPDWTPKWEPAQAAARMGYTPMTASRAVREIAGAGLGEVRREKRTQLLVMNFDQRETWKRAAPLMRSPVLRVAWVSMQEPGAYLGSDGKMTLPRSSTFVGPFRTAGLEALARRTMLAPPPHRIFAITREAFKLANVTVLPRYEPDAMEWQVWHYTPELGPRTDIVDPLSLILSLRDDPDERVQGALEELENTLPW